jgi:hypothetical protein
MSIDAMPSAAGRTAPRGWRADLWLALAAAAALGALYAAGGFASLTYSDGDNDSLLRLVEVRDLIGGQGWFDLHQYRMGPEGGFVSHWSRLVDAPIAAIILVLTPVLGPAMAETVAMVLWPLLMAAVALFCLVRAARSLGGEPSVMPAAVLGVLALHFVGVFAPGALDHHNVQLALTLAVLALLVDPRAAGAAGAAAALATAAMLAVGMEVAPYVAVAGIVAALDLVCGGERGRRLALGFGAGLAFGAALAFVATVPATAWGAAQCDTYSIAQFALVGISGAGLAAIAVLPAQIGARGRLAALAVLGAAVDGTLVAAFPQCLADPYAGMDPRLKTYWLSAVTEAQPLWHILATKPSMAVGHYATGLLGLVVLALGMKRRGLQRQDTILAAFLGTAMLVGLWQVRGTVFATPIAMIPLAGMVAAARARAARGVPGAAVTMVLAWLVSINLIWNAGAEALAKALPSARQAATGERGAAAAAAAGTCEFALDYDVAAALPPARILSVSNLGAPLLRYSGHSVLAGPYHRNVAGNLAALDAFMGSEADARAVIAREGIAYVAHCPGNPESFALAKWAPNGFMAALMRGAPLDWLEPLPETAGKPLRIFRVKPPAPAP